MAHPVHAARVLPHSTTKHRDVPCVTSKISPGHPKIPPATMRFSLHLRTTSPSEWLTPKWLSAMNRFTKELPICRKSEVHKLLVSYLEFKKFHESFSCLQEVHGYQQRCVPPVGPMTINHGKGWLYLVCVLGPWFWFFIYFYFSRIIKPCDKDSQQPNG